MDISIAVMVMTIVGSFFGMIVAVVWMGTRAKQRRIEAMASVQNHMVDKFSSAKEFVEFVQSPEGREFLRSSSEARIRPADRILGSMKIGIVSSLLGAGFVLLSFTAERDMIIPGVIILSIGIGYLLSSFFSLKLSRSWGLMSEEKSPVL